MADTPSVLVDSMTLRRRLLDKIDRPRDVSSAVKAALRQALIGVLAAHEEDKAELERADPSPESLKGLLKFVAHPHRADWVPPTLALNPEGYFAAVWDIGGERYAVEFLTASTANWIGITRNADQLVRSTGHYNCFDKYEESPFPISRRRLAP
jgi:hypothetical protein